jgi:hypothetical protein
MRTTRVLGTSLFTALAFAFAFGCSANRDEDSSPAPEVNGTAVSPLTVATPADLPKCTLKLKYTVVYVTSTATLLTCFNDAWVPIPVPTGPTGATGATGAQGASGLTTLVSSVPVAPGAQCVAGGLEINVGLDDNRDGSLQDGEVDQTSYVCNAPGPPTGIGPCATDAECDDQNACTNDFCSAGTCAHSMAAAGVVCRPANGACDAAEVCTGSSTVCPADAYAPTTTTCRPAVDACDAQEQCTGKSTVCPTDAQRPAGSVCRTAQACAAAVTCDGASSACAASVPSAQGTSCRAQSGACDLQEVCDGQNPTCPNDAIAPSGTTCQSACGTAGSCTGVNGSCRINDSSLACTTGTTKPCVCGTVVSGIQSCGSCNEWGSVCRLSTIRGSAVLYPADPKRAHDCGSASGTSSWASSSESSPCAPGDTIVSWSDQLPAVAAGYYTVTFQGSSYGALQTSLELFVDGVFVQARPVNGVTNMTFVTPSQCASVEVRLVFVSAPSSYSLKVDTIRIDY